MIYQLLAFAGATVFYGIPAAVRSRLFLPMTDDAIGVFREPVLPRIYRPDPRPEEIAGLFRKALNDRAESLSIEADDYPWKAAFRAADQPGALLLAALDGGVTVRLPPGALLRAGFETATDPPEVLDTAQILFGRTPLCLDMVVGAGGRLAVPCGDLPWMIGVPAQTPALAVNGRPAPLHPSRSGAWNLLGAGDLHRLGITAGTDLVTEAPPGTRLAVYFPFNALAFNAGHLSVTVPHGCPAEVSL